jgi:hypothetical protein
MVKAQIRLACYGKWEDVQLNMSESGVKDKISQHWIEMMLNKYKVLSHPLLKD